MAFIANSLSTMVFYRVVDSYTGEILETGRKEDWAVSVDQITCGPEVRIEIVQD